MNKYTQWLYKEIDLWVHDGVIDTGQRDVIKARYSQEQGVNWSRLIFSSLGAILIGLGVILLFAYNWEALHKYVKLGIVFVALLTAHSLGLWLRRSGSRQEIAGEGMHVLGTILFGAGIWLIAQIYHIDEHYPNAFLAWSVGALSLAWALPSIAQGFIAAFLLLLWGGFEVFDFRTVNHFVPVLILAGILPLAWQLRSRALTGMVLVSFMLSLTFMITRLDGDMIAPLLIFWSTAFIALSMIIKTGKSFQESSPVFQFWGYAFYVLLLYLLSFRDLVRSIDNIKFEDTAVLLYYLVSCAVAVFSWALAMWFFIKSKPDFSKIITFSHLSVPLTLLVVILASLEIGFQGWAGAMVFNMLFLFHSIIFIVHGSKTVNVKLVTAGCLMFSLLAMSRYVDLFNSLIARSLVFFIVGAGVFAAGNFYSRIKKQVQGEIS
jgi:hypothetical protein